MPEFSCARKETADIVIFAASKNDDRKIMQYIRITNSAIYQNTEICNFKFQISSTKESW